MFVGAISADMEHGQAKLGHVIRVVIRTADHLSLSGLTAAIELRDQNPVNYMNHAVVGEDIWNDDLGVRAP